jgi:hypothetical protein
MSPPRALQIIRYQRLRQYTDTIVEIGLEPFYRTGGVALAKADGNIAALAVALLGDR